LYYFAQVMRAITVGILSDTHLSAISPEFAAAAAACFAGASVILHAGDLTSPDILAAFADKEVYAVHGNMCGPASRRALPRKLTIPLGDFTIGLIHNSGYAYDFEARLPEEFAAVDCIVYGHTHRPVCHYEGGILFINPGSFQASGRFGAPGTYALLTVSDTLSARICEVGA